MITSGRTLATAALTDRASSASAMTGSAPHSESDALESCERTMPKVVCPASVRLLISGRPMAPVAPATKTFTAPPDFAHRLAWVWRVSYQSEPTCEANCSQFFSFTWRAPAPERLCPSQKIRRISPVSFCLRSAQRVERHQDPHKRSDQV